MATRKDALATDMRVGIRKSKAIIGEEPKSNCLLLETKIEQPNLNVNKII